MAWEQRGSASYYYTAERIDGRVVKQYVGTGPVAELAAELDAIRMQERAEAAERERCDREELAALESALTPLNELADALTAAALVAAGYHRPKRGPWRKRRG
ncbi:MAG: hypothetical protein K2V38_06445 [Gemmataceae bacterium]|nr:hypothetical protein [Gemmataceae bacterium]